MTRAGEKLYGEWEKRIDPDFDAERAQRADRQLTILFSAVGATAIVALALAWLIW